jgi:hypothetical protein
MFLAGYAGHVQAVRTNAKSMSCDAAVVPCNLFPSSPDRALQSWRPPPLTVAQQRRRVVNWRQQMATTACHFRIAQSPVVVMARVRVRVRVRARASQQPPAQMMHPLLRLLTRGLEQQRRKRMVMQLLRPLPVRGRQLRAASKGWRLRQTAKQVCGAFVAWARSVLQRVGPAGAQPSFQLQDASRKELHATHASHMQL